MAGMSRLVLLVVAASFGMQAPTAGATGATSLIDGRFEANSRRARVELAREMLVEVNRLADIVAPPRPYDLTWVAEQHAALARLEPGDGFSTRVDLFYRTPAFQHVRLYNVLRELKNAVACVAEPNVALRRELSCWAAAALLLADRSTFVDSVNALKQAQRLPERPAQDNLGTAEGLAVRYSLYSRGINEYLVLPYLRGDLR